MFELYFPVLIIEESFDVPRLAAVVEVAVLDAEIAEYSLFARPHSHLSVAKYDIVRIIGHSSVVDLAIVLLLNQFITLIVGG